MAKVKVELTIPTDLKDEPIIYTIGQEFNVVPNIIEASFSTSTGWVVMTIDGEKADIDMCLDMLKLKNVEVKHI